MVNHEFQSTKVDDVGNNENFQKEDHTFFEHFSKSSSFCENFPDNSTSSTCIAYINNKSKGSHSFLHNLRSFIEPSVLFLSLFESISREFPDGHILPSQTGLIDIDFSSHQDTVTHNFLKRINEISWDKLITLHFDKLSISEYPHSDSFFSHVLNFFVTQINQNVVDGCCHERETQTENGECCDVLDNVSNTHNVLQQEEWTSQNFKHICNVIRDLHGVSVSSILCPGLLYVLVIQSIAQVSL